MDSIDLVESICFVIALSWENKVMGVLMPFICYVKRQKSINNKSGTLNTIRARR